MAGEIVNKRDKVKNIKKMWCEWRSWTCTAYLTTPVGQLSGSTSYDSQPTGSLGIINDIDACC